MFRNQGYRSIPRSCGVFLVITYFLLSAGPVLAQPPVQGKEFSVVSRDPHATRVGYEILEAGGTAADAAFAVASVLSVAEGHFSHVMGGGTWALYYEKASNRVYALDGVGPTGSSATPAVYRNPKSGKTNFGMHLANVPGAWEGWMQLLARFGSMDLPRLMEPAIELARNGVPASRSMVGFIRQEEANIRSMPHTRKIFLPDGKIPAVGQTIVQKNLARTFTRVVNAFRHRRSDGYEEALKAAGNLFYRGALAREFVQFSRGNGGTWEFRDFSSYHAEFAEPITADYKGLTVYQNPPNSQGITMLMALNILKGYDFSRYEQHSPEAIHLIAEATKLAHVDKHFYIGDPDFCDIPLATLLSDNYAALQRDRIRMNSALSWPIEGGLSRTGEFNTTTYQIVDRYGNAAAVTTSIGSQFLVVGETGVLINQRVANLSLEEDLPNYLQPRKKVRHTSNPYMVFKDGRLHILGGNTGFDTQPQGQIQQFMNVVEFGMNPQEAVSAPRFITHSFPASTYPHKVRDVLVMEWGFPSWVRNRLAEKGHKLGDYAIFGNANMTVIDPETGIISLGADPRGENLGMAR